MRKQFKNSNSEISTPIQKGNLHWICFLHTGQKDANSVNKTLVSEDNIAVILHLYNTSNIPVTSHHKLSFIEYIYLE